MAETVRVYINARGIEVPGSATAIQAVEAWNPAQAAAIRSGERMITDSRGLPADPGSTIHNGAIFRIVHARTATSDSADETETL